MIIKVLIPLIIALKLFSQDINKIPEKVALLTFDDGPIRATKNILDVVKDENIDVTMFFIGYQIESFKNIYEYALSLPNITIANHTYSHANGKYRKFYSDAKSVVEDIKRANIIVSEHKVSKTTSKFLPVRLAGRNVFRLPTIKTNDNVIDIEQRKKEIIGYDDIFNEGFYIYGWDLEWRYDSTGRPIQTALDVFNNMEKIYKRGVSKKDGKVVLLMHDIMFSNHFDGKENLKELIKLLKNGGWRFENIENY